MVAQVQYHQQLDEVEYHEGVFASADPDGTHPRDNDQVGRDGVTAVVEELTQGAVGTRSPGLLAVNGI